MLLARRVGYGERDYGAPLTLLLLAVARASIPSGTEDDYVVASDGDSFDYYGAAVSGAGDVDGDGYDDVVIGAYNDTDTSPAAGSLYVYRGSSSGLDAGSERKLVPTGLTRDAWFGIVLTGGGDVDGDGYSDIVVGAPQDSATSSFQGSASVWYGSASGLDGARVDRVDASDGGSGDFFGFAAAMLGDVDGDGYDDFAVGSYLIRGHGVVYVEYGGPTGVDLAREQILEPGDLTASSYFGFAIGGGGDLDGDGYADLVVGAPGDSVSTPGAGVLYVYYGGPAGIDTARLTRLGAIAPATSELLGISVVIAGDLDGDGYADLAAGTQSGDGAATDSGTFHVWYGAAGGVDGTRELVVQSSDGEAFDYFGYHLAALGDADGDGYDDLATSAHYEDTAGSLSGSAYFYPGGPGGLDPTRERKIVPRTVATSGDQFGVGLAAAGDLDGDGCTDLVGGAPFDDSVGTDGGAAYWFRGGTDADGDRILAVDDCDDTDATVGEASPAWDDADADGYGDPATAHTDCAPAATNGDDCDDTDATVHPGAADAPDDGVDSDCDGTAETVDTGGDSGGDSGDSGGDSGDSGGDSGDSGGDSGDPLPDDTAADLHDTAEDKPTGCGCTAGPSVPRADPPFFVGLAALLASVVLVRRRPSS